MRSAAISVLALFCAGAVAAEADQYPMKIPAPGGEVILPDERAKRSYDTYRYAAARRVDNMLYVSGVIVGRGPDEGRDVQAFKEQTRRALARLKQILEAAGASYQDVVMINSFHVWQGPDFQGTRDEQFSAFQEVMDEFLKPPYPAWTAVGTSGLLGSGGIVEVQLIARMPEK